MYVFYAVDTTIIVTDKSLSDFSLDDNIVVKFIPYIKFSNYNYNYIFYKILNCIYWSPESSSGFNFSFATSEVIINWVFLKFVNLDKSCVMHTLKLLVHLAVSKPTWWIIDSIWDIKDFICGPVFIPLCNQFRCYHINCRFPLFPLHYNISNILLYIQAMHEEVHFLSKNSNHIALSCVWILNLSALFTSPGLRNSKLIN